MCLATGVKRIEYRVDGRYPRETMLRLEEPVASIPLKSLRRGSQDYEYFWLLARDVETESGRLGVRPVYIG